MSDEEIAMFMSQMGFELKNPSNWTYATPDIYLSDMHDENGVRRDRSPCISRILDSPLNNNESRP